MNISPNGSCVGSCDDFTFSKNYRCDNDTLCAPNYLDKNKTRCEGEVRDCSFVESDMWICPNVIVIIICTIALVLIDYRWF